MSAAQTAQQVARRVGVVIEAVPEKVNESQIIWGEPVVHTEGTYYSSKITTRTFGRDPATGRECVILDVDIKEFDRA